MTRRPLAIDLYAGLGGWTDGLLAAGWDCVGFDNEAHVYGDQRYPGQLVVQDVLTLHGSQFRGAGLIVASPPCTEYSYMAMPWSRAKQIGRALRGADDFPEGYTGSRSVAELNALFDACFRIKAEASAAAGRDIPLIVENVRGAQPWVGPARWNFGSFYLWGDVPALMPPDGTGHGPGSWFAVADSKNRGAKNPGFRFGGGPGDPSASFQSESVARHLKAPGGAHIRDGADHTARLTNPNEGRKHGGDFSDPSSPGRQGGAGRKQPGISGPRTNGRGDRWFQDVAARHGSKSAARKQASAEIAKIPLALAEWIGRAYL